MTDRPSNDESSDWDADESWSDWTDEQYLPPIDSDALRRRRETARAAAEHDDPDLESRYDRVFSSEQPSRSSAKSGRSSTKSTRSTQRSASRSREDEFTDVLAAPMRRSRGCVTGLIVTAILGVAAFGGYRWLNQQIDPPGPPGLMVEVAVPSGTSGSELGELLETSKVIRNAKIWKGWTQLNSVGKFQAGKYQFPVNSSFDEVVAVLAVAPAVPQQQKLTIPPGFRLTQVAERVGSLPEKSASRFLTVAQTGLVRSALMGPESVKSLEGFIAAETLNFDLADDEADILAKLVDEFDRQAREAGIMTAPEKVGYSPYEVLIIASLIEREVKFADERPKVARVVYNRLKQKRALQLDATTVYELGGGVATAADLKKDGPYNTYTNKGLPPTPIASPSLESIKAALAPAEGDWLFYVVTEKDGRSSFANTFSEHKKNIQLGKKNGALT
jgi:UPF0755 protein